MGIDLSFRDECALLTIDNPLKSNALNAAMIDDLERAVRGIGESKSRATVIVGTGDKAFCAGADVKELLDLEIGERVRRLDAARAIFTSLECSPVPSIAVINGLALGGGLELALAATFRLATANAVMALPEIKLGLLPGYGGTQRLPRVVGRAMALEMILTGRSVKAEEAKAIGLVSKLVDGDPVQAGIEFARGFAQYSLATLQLSRKAVQAALDVPLDVGLRMEGELVEVSNRTDDAREGMQAFVDKRKPNFQDR